MTLTLQLDPNSLSNPTLSMRFSQLFSECLDFNVVVTGDVFGGGTWQEAFGDPVVPTTGEPYGSGFNSDACPWKTEGRWVWNVVDHRVS